MRTILKLIFLLFLIPILNGQITLKVKNITCFGREDGRIEVVSSQNLGSVTYSWSHDQNLAGNRAWNLKPGVYSVTISLEGNSINNTCTLIKQATVHEPSKLVVNIAAFASIPLEGGCNIQPRTRVKLKAQFSGGTPPYQSSFGSNHTMEVVTPVNDIVCVATDSLGCVDTDSWSSQEGIIRCSSDPNDITGNVGIDSSRWVAKKDELIYKVRFENDANLATANASKVFLDIPLDDDIDPFSILLSNFGFDNQIYEVPQNTNTYQTRIDLTSTRGIFVDVTSGLDIANNRLIWQFETIDPSTGQPPIDPTLGFLPINDTLLGNGEGFVTFIAKPKSFTLTGEIINEQASIIFDVNQPIVTNVWSNKVDAYAPTSTLNILPDTVDNDTIHLCWNAIEDLGGVGLKSYRILYSVNGGNPITLANEWQYTCIDFIGLRGNTYDFKVLAKDKVNNEETKVNFEQTVFINPIPEINLIHGDYVCSNDTLQVDAEITSIHNVNVYISFNNGNSYTFFANLDTSALPLKYFISSSLAGQSIKVKFVDANSSYEKVSGSILVKSLPNVNAGNDISSCGNDQITLNGQGANDYMWSPIGIMGSPFESITNIYPITNTFTITLSGIDVFGCKNVDSVSISIHPTYLDTISTPLCQGDSLFINGTWIKTPGYYPTTYSSVFGCDSTIVSHITYQNPCIWSGGPHVYVNDDATGDNTGIGWTHAFNDLQSAIYVAGRYENVQEIWVAEGTYKPSVSDRDTSFVLKDSIKIFGGFVGNESLKSERTSDASLVILSGDINLPDTLWDNSYHAIISKEMCMECVIDGVTVTYGYADQASNQNDIGAGVLNFGNISFENVIFERNNATNIGAALFSTGNNAHVKIKNCEFRLNNSSMGKDVINTNGSLLQVEGINMIKE